MVTKTIFAGCKTLYSMAYQLPAKCGFFFWGVCLPRLLLLLIGDFPYQKTIVFKYFFPSRWSVFAMNVLLWLYLPFYVQ